MDTLMHGLAGMVIAAYQPRTVVPERRAIYWAVAIAAEVPDLDLIMMPAGPMGHLYYHRGLLHSLLMAPLLAVAVAFLVSRFFKGTRVIRLVPWTLVGVIFGHLFLDWMTSFGTRLFLPLSNTWLASDWTSEVELCLFLPPLIALTISFFNLRWRVPLLRAAGALMIAFIAYRAVAHTVLQRELAQSYGVPVNAVTVEPIIYRMGVWEYVIRAADNYRTGWVYLGGRHQERAELPRVTPESDPVLAEALQTGVGRQIWHFVRNPVLSKSRTQDGYLVAVSDLRGGYALNFTLALDDHGHLRRAGRDFRHECLLEPEHR